MNTTLLYRRPAPKRLALTVLLWTSLLSVFSGALFAQQETFREVVVMFDRGMIRLPEGRDSATVAEAVIASPAIRNVLQTQGAELLLKAFPTFNLADTLGVALSGEIVRLTDFSKVFKIRLPEGAEVNMLAAALSGLLGVWLARKRAYPRFLF